MAARRLHHLIYATIGNCCLFLIVCAIALGTNKWFSLNTGGNFETVGGTEVSFGLWKGEKTKVSISQVKVRYSLKLVCKGLKGCMFSCGITADKRKQDLESLLEGKDEMDYLWCVEQDEEALTESSDNIKSSFSRFNANATIGNIRRSRSKLVGTAAAAFHQAEEEDDDDSGGSRRFINFGLYLSTIGFLALAIIFAIISGTLALYNTYRTPIRPALSVYGLYFWNGSSAIFVLLAMIMWLIEFTSRLRKNAAISDTISGTYDAAGKGSLGISFWILVLPILFALTNIAILKYRKWKIVKMEEKHIRVMKRESDGNGETILF